MSYLFKFVDYSFVAKKKRKKNIIYDFLLTVSGSCVEFQEKMFKIGDNKYLLATLHNK